VNTLDSSLNIPDNTGWKIVGTDDFNGDGPPDILWHRSIGESQVWFMNGATRAGAMNLDTVPDPTGWQIVGTGDFDGALRYEQPGVSVGRRLRCEPPCAAQ
jgi:hypothetical protein